MTPPAVLAVSLALSAVTVAAAIGWLAAAILWIAARRMREAPASARAALLAQARLMPLTAVVILAPAQMLAFARFEAGVDESAGPLLLSLALVGVALVIDAMVCGARAWRRTRQVVDDWQRTASPLKVPSWTRRAWSISRRFPVVAVVGIARPQLFVARQVASSCTADELAAIVAHEAAHLRARDNLVRLLYCVTPGSRGMSMLAQAIERDWIAASEESADAFARRTTSALELASALTKVARLADGCESEPLPASALIGEHGLESRVQRLLEPPVSGRRTRLGWAPALVAAAILATLQTTPVLVWLHEAFELLVRK